MTREMLSVALARQVGRVLTPDLAVAIAREADSEPDFTVDPIQFAPRVWGDFSFQCETLAAAGLPLRQQRVSYLYETQPALPARPDWARLLVMQRRGHHVIFTARHGEARRLVASIWLFLDWSIDTEARTVTDDLFYVEPAHRGGMLAARLWQYAESSMFAFGVRDAVFHSRLDNGAARLARYLGYRAVATRVTKTHLGDDFAEVPTRRKEVFGDSIV
ncbi:hypothetical protein D3C86_1182420 [compost metagenome]